MAKKKKVYTGKCATCGMEVQAINPYFVEQHFRRIGGFVENGSYYCCTKCYNSRKDK